MTSESIDKELTALVARCRDWLNQEQKFASILTDACTMDEEMAEVIAARCEVSRRVVECWANQTAVPHPNVQRKIIEALASLQPNAQEA